MFEDFIWGVLFGVDVFVGEEIGDVVDVFFVGGLVLGVGFIFGIIVVVLFGLVEFLFLGVYGVFWDLDLVGGFFFWGFFVGVVCFVIGVLYFGVVNFIFVNFSFIFVFDFRGIFGFVVIFYIISFDFIILNM